MMFLDEVVTMRNYALVRISTDLFSEWLKQGWKIPDDRVVAIECIKGLPQDARYIRTYYDETRDQIVMVFEHLSFDHVPEGTEIPTKQIIYKNTYAPIEAGIA